jgi:hypothetical protein
MEGALLGWLSKFMPTDFMKGDHLLQHAVRVSEASGCAAHPGECCQHLQTTLPKVVLDQFLSQPELGDIMKRLSQKVFGCQAVAQLLGVLVLELSDKADSQVRGEATSVEALRRKVGQKRKRRLGEESRRKLLKTLLRQRQVQQTSDLNRLAGRSATELKRDRERMIREHLEATHRVAGQFVSGQMCLSHDSTRIGNPGREWDCFLVCVRGVFKTWLPQQALGAVGVACRIPLGSGGGMGGKEGGGGGGNTAEAVV